MKSGKMFELVVSDADKHEFDRLIFALKRETYTCGGLFVFERSLEMRVPRSSGTFLF